MMHPFPQPNVYLYVEPLPATSITTRRTTMTDTITTPLLPATTTRDASAACCDSTALSTCCEPSAKSECCGTPAAESTPAAEAIVESAAPSSCGCR